LRQAARYFKKDIRMKATFLTLLLAMVLLTSCQAQKNSTDFKKLDWLIGTWKGETNDQPFYENWTKLSDTEFDNANYSICNGDTIRGGHSKIQFQNGKIVFTSDNQIWELKDLNDTLAVFENLQRGEKFTFSQTASGSWRANLKYPKAQVEYLLSKTSSIGDLVKVKPEPIVGFYQGYIEFNGKKLFTSITFDSKSGKPIAFTSTPDNLQLNMPFNEVCYNPPFLKLRLRDGIQTLELNAKVQEDVITGKLAGEIPADINLKKATPPDISKNYQIIALTIENGDTKLPANLFLPASDKPVGAVIMISGTGQHVKEAYNGWADKLASKGVAVLTYNKRNVTSFPNLNIRQASSDIVLPGQLESDIEAAIKLLKSKKEINPKKIGLFGFSQGAVMAPIVASKGDVAFLIAVAGNTTTDQEFIINQSLNKLRQRNFNETALKRTREIWENLFQYSKDKKGGDKLQKELDKAYEQGFGRFAVPRHLPNDDEIKYLSTWNSFELDPSVYWSKLGIPAFVAYGDRDVLIPVRESVVILNTLYRDKPQLLTLKVYKDADHFIKQIPDRNNFDFPKHAAGYIDDVVNWIVEQAK
jgi:dienelactone hydrolase